MNMKLIVSLVAGILVGCVSEQELREQAMSQDAVVQVHGYMDEGRYDDAMRLCDETEAKCLKYKYDWSAVKKLIATEKVKARQAEYDAWRASDDGDKTVAIDEFEAKFRDGWRNRAESKKEARMAREAKEKAERLAKEAKEREERERKAAEEARQRKIAQEKRMLKAQRESLIAYVCSNSLRIVRKSYVNCLSPYPHPEADEKLKVVDVAMTAKRRELDRLREIGKKDSKEYKKVHGEFSELFRVKYVDSHWTKHWVDSRLELSDQDKFEGDAVLAEFGDKYLPKAYGMYEKKRDAAKELQQVYNEEFQNPGDMRENDSRWDAYNKVLEKLARLRAEYFVSRDELCHYWVLYQFGVVSADELRKEDDLGLAPRLYAENVEQLSYTQMVFGYEKTKVFEYPSRSHTNNVWRDEVPELAEFANKYAPECAQILSRLLVESGEAAGLFYKVQDMRRKMDDVRYNRTMMAGVQKFRAINKAIDDLCAVLNSWRTEHRTTLKSSEDVAILDHEYALKQKDFVTSLPDYIRIKSAGPVIPNDDMVAIPGRAYKMQRTELTQWQWILVMGDNPSKKRWLWNPVENVSYDRVMQFICKLNALDLDGAGTYRLPTCDEWRFACAAGSQGAWALLVNGREGKSFELGVTEGPRNLREHKNKHHCSVATRMPNAWGIYDMHGNVAEYCHEKDVLGGAWDCFLEECTCTSSQYGCACNSIGFRLAR